MYATELWQGQAEEPTVEEKWDLIRDERNARLANSDWTQLGDTPMTTAQKDTWTAYRQTLRDLPQDYTDPNLVYFPEVP